MRVLVLPCLLAVVSAETYWPWDPRSSRKPSSSNTGSIGHNSFFFPSDSTHISSAQAAANEIKDIMITVEEKMQRFCRKYTNQPLKEDYGATHYRLYANLTECTEAGVDVRAGQRLVSVQSKDSRCDYVALRLLPDTVDSNSAFWQFENGILTITFPYKSARRRCGRVISSKVHQVPKFKPDDDDEYPDMDRFVETLSREIDR